MSKADKKLNKGVFLAAGIVAGMALIELIYASVTKQHVLTAWFGNESTAVLAKHASSITKHAIDALMALGLMTWALAEPDKDSYKHKTTGTMGLIALAICIYLAWGAIVESQVPTTDLGWGIGFFMLVLIIDVAGMIFEALVGLVDMIKGRRKQHGQHMRSVVLLFVTTFIPYRILKVMIQFIVQPTTHAEEAWVTDMSAALSLLIVGGLILFHKKFAAHKTVLMKRNRGRWELNLALLRIAIFGLVGAIALATFLALTIREPLNTLWVLLTLGAIAFMAWGIHKAR